MITCPGPNRRLVLAAYIALVVVAVLVVVARALPAGDVPAPNPAQAPTHGTDAP